MKCDCLMPNAAAAAMPNTAAAAALLPAATSPCAPYVASPELRGLACADSSTAEEAAGAAAMVALEALGRVGMVTLERSGAVVREVLEALRRITFAECKKCRISCIKQTTLSARLGIFLMKAFRRRRFQTTLSEFHISTNGFRRWPTVDCLHRDVMTAMYPVVFLRYVAKIITFAVFSTLSAASPLLTVPHSIVPQGHAIKILPKDAVSKASKLLAHAPHHAALVVWCHSSLPALLPPPSRRRRCACRYIHPAYARGRCPSCNTLAQRFADTAMQYKVMLLLSLPRSTGLTLPLRISWHSSSWIAVRTLQAGGFMITEAGRQVTQWDAPMY
jgi:hypothetical protein